MSGAGCNCAHIDGFRIRRIGCPVHGEVDRRVRQQKEAERRAEVDADMAAAWSDYRKDYGVGRDEMSAAHKAFKAGWMAAREGDQSGVLR